MASTRMALLALLWVCALTTSTAAQDQDPLRAARFEAPTDRYPHNIMGRLPAHGGLVVETVSGQTHRSRLPDRLVFEDFAPRLIDTNGDGRTEIVVVESDRDRGARLAIWSVTGDGLTRIAATPFIGRRFRWLAPIGAADFDGDGRPELAYVEKPHLDKVLHIVRHEGNRLVPVARLAGISNHAIGQETLQSRIDTCPGGPQIVALDGSGQRQLAIRLTANRLEARDLGPAPTAWQIGHTRACD
ncbi:FG-GAP repeat domain-containing protein [Gemmobacter denitrificans]|uniref:VCBS repeat-containing protein n=1 Tax=Gemmobacter denitrificans TaxID=3123040 RepID=A0ABU8BSS3_9RHOB